MRWRLLAGVGVLGAIATAGACALDIPDVIVEGGVDGNVPDTITADINVPDVPVPQCDASCAPTGFTPALFALDRTTACPTGMQTLDLAADPGAAPPSACSCSCTVTNPPKCVPATITHSLSTIPSFDGGYTCPTGGTPLDVDGGCNIVPDGGAINIHYAWEGDPFAPVEAGTCTSNATVNAAAVPSTASRLCVDTTCAGTCASQGNLQACVYAQGSVPCPSGFKIVHHAGAVSVSCSQCSSCSVTTDGGCQGTLSLYSDLACNSKITDVSFDGGCASTGSANGQMAPSIRYNPLVVGAACNAGTSSPSGVSLAGEITVCCP